MLLDGKEKLGRTHKILHMFDKGKEIHLWACWGLGWERLSWPGASFHDGTRLLIFSGGHKSEPSSGNLHWHLQTKMTPTNHHVINLLVA